jgi:hypothetical protein
MEGEKKEEEGKKKRTIRMIKVRRALLPPVKQNWKRFLITPEDIP